jgi:macrolide transport system ATP-binding/permease protein
MRSVVSGMKSDQHYAVSFSLRLYRTLAEAFPHEFKNVYGEELLIVTEDAVDHIWRQHGILGLARLVLDIAIRVPVEHFAEIRQDIRYGLRTLVASPGFTFVALVSLSLGICIATCAFSQMNGFALRSLPGARNPSQLVALQSPASYPNYMRFREQSDLFSSTAAYVAPVPFAVALGGRTERIWGHLVTPSYFSTFGVHPALGMFFDSSQASVVVVSQRFWRERLGSDRSMLGQTLRVNGQPATVIGVAPEDFLGASPLLFAADLWIPVSAGGSMAPELAGNALERRDLTMFSVVGRLQSGITISRAEAELDTIARQLDKDNGDADRAQKGRRIQLVEGGKLLPLRKQDLPFFTSFLATMASLIMLIACANVANMMLARAAGRRREIAVRLALGASRARIIRQLLTESMMIAVAAGIIGFVASMWLMRLSSRVRMPFPMPVTFDFQPDGRVLLLTLALSLCTGLLFGLAPALQSTRTDVMPAIKGGSGIFFRTHRRFSLRNLLMVGQMAGSLTLLVVLGLLSVGIQTTLGIQAGFNPKNLYLISLDPIRDGYSAERAAALFARLLDRVKALPGITDASLTETVPVSMPGTAVTISMPSGRQRVALRALKHVVGVGYFDTTGISILYGRGFSKGDDARHSTRVIVSEALARELGNGGEAVGQEIEVGNGEIGPPKILPGSFDFRPTVMGNGVRTFEIIGVAANVAEGLVVQKRRPALYFPLTLASYTQPSLQGVTLIVRAAPGVDGIAMVRREVSAIDDGIVPFNARSMEDQIGQFIAPLRMAAWTYGLIGVFGLVLASVGLAGATAYAIAQRRREIGIRRALGASNQDVLWLIMSEGLVLVTIGTSLGMAGSWAGARILSAMNSSVGRVTSTSTSDPTVLIGAPILLAFLALIACYIPARKSMLIDPSITLREE